LGLGGVPVYFFHLSDPLTQEVTVLSVKVWSFIKQLVLVSMVSLPLALGLPMASGAEKPEKLTIAVIGDFSGPYKPVVGAFKPGAEDATSYVNEELGGIDGVKLNLLLRDNQGKAALGVRQYDELVSGNPKPAFVAIAHSPTSELVRDRLEKDDVIGFFPTGIKSLYPVSNIYGFFPLYVNQAAALVKWVKDNWKEKRNPRVAVVTWDTPYGQAIMRPQFWDYCEKIGVDIVAKEVFGIRETDLTGHLVRVRSKKPDWILTNTVASGPLAIMKAAKEMGMNVKLLNTVGGGHGTVRLEPDLFEDCVTFLHSVSYDTEDHPGMQLLKGYMKKYRRGIQDQTIFYTVGWQYVLMVHKALTEAVAKGGWDKLNTAAIVSELNKLTDWEPLDGVVKVSYTPKLRSTRWGLLYRIKGGKIVPAGGTGGDGQFLLTPDLTPKEFR
jgi:branched-chain amino acid transport system substrate-binding protein